MFSEASAATRGLGDAWPSRETISRWIECTGRARTMDEARHAARQPRSAGLPRPHLPAGRSVPAAFRRGLLQVAAEQPLGDCETDEPDASDRNAPAGSSPVHPAGTFHLEPGNPVVDAPSIGPRTAARLERIGIIHISDLLACDADETAQRLGRRGLSGETIRTWQRQARLMCSIPDVRGRDAQVLAACGVAEPADLCRFSPSLLFGIVSRYAQSAEGQRLLRSAEPPDLADVTRWIESARRASTRRAA
jgi:hypothetical protein